MKWCRLCFCMFLLFVGLLIAGCFYHPILWIAGFLTFFVSACLSGISSLFAKLQEYP